MAALATAYFTANRLNVSIPLFEQLVDVYSKIHGEHDFKTLFAGANLGVNYAQIGRNQEALTLIEKAYNAKNGGLSFIFGPSLVGVYVDVGQIDEAEELAESHIKAIRHRLPPKSPVFAQQLLSISPPQSPVPATSA